MAVTIQLRRGTAAAWTSANPTLALGEVGIETDTKYAKVGDGSTAWTSLGYMVTGSLYAPKASPALTGQVTIGTTAVTGFNPANSVLDLYTPDKFVYLDSDASGEWGIQFRGQSGGAFTTIFKFAANGSTGQISMGGFHAAYFPVIYSGNAAALTFDTSQNATFAGNLTVANGKNLVFNTSTGTKIGTATGQKIGFWNATPIIQPTTGVAAATFVANTSAIADDTATFDGYTIGQVVKALRNAGLLA